MPAEEWQLIFKNLVARKFSVMIPYLLWNLCMPCLRKLTIVGWSRPVVSEIKIFLKFKEGKHSLSFQLVKGSKKEMTLEVQYDEMI